MLSWSGFGGRTDGRARGARLGLPPGHYYLRPRALPQDGLGMYDAAEVREADVSELHLRYKVRQGRALGGNGGAAADVTRVDETFGS